MDERVIDRPRRRRAIAAAAGVAAIGLTLFALADGYLRHGYSATWYQEIDFERHELTRTTEHRPTFPNAHRALSRVIQGWPFDRLGRPDDLPAIDVTLRAQLRVPEGRPYHLAADADDWSEIWVDGERYAPQDSLAPGDHDLWVRWSARPQPHGSDSGRQRRSDTARFELRWGPGVQPATPVPASALTPAAGRWPSSRGWLWALGLPLLLLAVFWGWHSARAPRSDIRARRWGALATVLVVALSIGYRGFDYDVMPEFRENADELFATWNGWSLLAYGETRGWSLWAHDYQGRAQIQEVRIFGEERTVISPYFEHPPLLHALVGAAALLGGADHWLEAKLTHTRLVPIGLGALCTLLIVLITRRITGGRGPAPWLASGLYAVLPSIVLQTRVIKEEALLTVLVTAMIFFFQRWRDDGHRWRDLILAAVCAGAAPLAKVPAVVYVPALVMLVAAERGHAKRAFAALGIAAAVASLLPLFGWLVDWDTFVYTTGRQGTRPVHWNLFPRWFDFTKINHNIVGRGWILFLWLGFAASIFRRGWRQTAPITVPLVAYMCAIAIGAGNWTFGWYIVPFYPLLCVGAGLFLARLWEEPDLLSGTLFVVLLIMYSLNFTLDVDYAKQPASWSRLRGIVTVFCLCALAPYGAAQVWRRSPTARGLARLATAIGLGAVLVLSARFVARYDVLYESHHSLDGDEYFTR